MKQTHRRENINKVFDKAQIIINNNTVRMSIGSIRELIISTNVLIVENGIKLVKSTTII